MFSTMTCHGFFFDCRVTTELPLIRHNKSEDHWDIETGYNEKASNDILSFPYRAHSGGSRGALVVLLNLNASHYDHMCRGPIVGFKGMHWNVLFII